MMRRSEAWEQQYVRSPYLERLSLAALAERLRWLVENIATLNECGQLGAVFPQADGERLWIAFTHTMMEFRARGKNPPDGFLTGAQVPRSSHPRKPAEALAYEARTRAEPGELFKFGRQCHLDGIVSTGSIKVRAASYYKDPSLNYAISDDELRFTVYPNVSDINLLAPSGPVGTISVKGARFGLTHPGDFYIFCATSRFSLRLFQDFKVDSCLIIYDHADFVRRFHSAIARNHPDWLFRDSAVAYVDPYNPGPTSPVIPISKHLRFAYQQERRLVLQPPTSIPPALPDLDLTIGNCADIAEAVGLVRP